MINWSPGQTLEQIEKQVILQAYRFYEQNKTHTAAALGISIRTLDGRLADYAAQPVKVDRPVRMQDGIQPIEGRPLPKVQIGPDEALKEKIIKR